MARSGKLTCTAIKVNEIKTIRKSLEYHLKGETIRFLSSQFSDLLRHDLDNAGLSDVKLVNKSGDSILGHKCVFLSRSDFFQALFEDHFHESNVQHDSFCLANISGNALRNRLTMHKFGSPVKSVIKSGIIIVSQVNILVQDDLLIWMV